MRDKIIVLMLLMLLPVISPARSTFEFGPDPRPKSESTALLLPLAGSVMPVTAGLTITDSELRRYLLGGGILIGPSLGYFYCSNAERGLKSIGIRAGLCTGALVLGFVFNSWAVAYLGAGAVIIHSTSDILNAPNVAREYNQYLDDLSFSLAPRYDTERDALMLNFATSF